MKTAHKTKDTPKIRVQLQGDMLIVDFMQGGKKEKEERKKIEDNLEEMENVKQRKK